jgi:hypothetical protein
MRAFCFPVAGQRPGVKALAKLILPDGLRQIGTTGKSPENASSAPCKNISIEPSGKSLI